MMNSVNIPAGVGHAGTQLHLCVDESSVSASLVICRKERVQALACSSAWARDSWDLKHRVFVTNDALVVGAHYTLATKSLHKAIDWLRSQGVEVSVDLPREADAA
ncbi:hypothetical protein Xtri_02720 [Xanthomonas campestris pv. trichodesmae]|uniref:Uncharacterized protein n=3 Tax=Xanthomonas citri TaxID=346 RepID=A0AB33C937_XANCI|nr:hypothetical protein XcvCFBP7111P_05755 [Xanthomonas citri pv. vignicola]MBZ3921772.1 hypothetical protein [Xanthomonas campestris pv. trichodesmae]MBZ3926372.1 hypothetical protein [Xanthomonas citri pv. sesbaniae]